MNGVLIMETVIIFQIFDVFVNCVYFLFFYFYLFFKFCEILFENHILYEKVISIKVIIIIID